MTKSLRYYNLVAKFKKYKFSDPNLLNPHHIKGFDYEVINPWELWQGNLDAEIMFIGQDFSDSTSLEDNLKYDWKKEKDSPTNKILIDFFKILNYNITDINYLSGKEHRLFFTNAILGIKKSEYANMAKAVKNNWWKETSVEYLKELIDIVEPKYIITMGRISQKAICGLYDISAQINIGSETKLPDGKTLFVVQHCSPLGRISRSMDKQISDWTLLKDLINTQ